MGSQESNSLNGVQIGVETKKLWSLQENCTELSGNFAHLNPRCENFRTVRNTSLAHEWHFAQPKPIFVLCETRCENFAHHYSRCENVRTVLNTLLAHEWHFAHLKPIFARCETRCEFLSPKYGNFARCNSRCEILILRCENFC